MKHILFDLDGTLIDSAPSILSCYAMVLKQRGIKPKCVLTKSLIGPPLLPTLERISGVTDELLLAEFADEFKSYYDEYGYKETLEYPDITRMLTGLAEKGFHLYIVTNKRIYPTIKILNMFGWDALFKGVYAADFFSPPLAPKARVLQRVRDFNGIEAGAGLYVGDREEDLEASNRANLNFLGVSWGYGSWQKTPSDSSVRFASSVGELYAVILSEITRN